MRRLALGLLLFCGGLALWAGLAQTQTDPWWHPLNPAGQSHGVTYGTVLPALANTGSRPTDGLLAVQITSGSPPVLNIYDSSASAWRELISTAAIGVTDNTIPVWDAGLGVFEDSVLSDDGTTLTLAAGSIFSIGDGSTADDTIRFGAGNDAFVYWDDANSALHFEMDSTVGADFNINATSTLGARYFRIQTGTIAAVIFQNPIAAASRDLWGFTDTLAAMDAVGGDIINALYVNLTNANHTGGTLNGLNLTLDAGDAQATENALSFSANWDNDIFFTTSGTVAVTNGGAISWQANSTTRMQLDTTGSAEEFSVLTATGLLNTFQVLVGTTATQITPTGTASEGQYTFDNVPAAGASGTMALFAGTLTAMDAAGGDIVRGLYLDLTNANHTGGALYGTHLELDTGDAQAYESALSLSGAWDTHITFTEIGASPPNNPPTGQVAMFVDDNADYSGAGGNDCILGIIDSAGAIDIVTTIVLNGACP